MNKTETQMINPVYFGPPILNMNKIVVYECRYVFTNPKCGDNVKLCYTDTGTFTVHVKSERV